MIQKNLFIESKTEKEFFACLILNGFLSCCWAIGTAFCITSAVKRVFLERQGLSDIIGVLLLFLFIVLIKTITTGCFSFYFRNAANRIKNRLIMSYVETIMESGPVFNQSRNTGGSASYVCEAADAIEPYYYEYLPALFSLFISLPLILTTAFFLDWISALIMLITGPVLPFFLYLIGTNAAKANDARMNSLNRLGGSLLDILSGMRTVRIYARTALFREKVEETSDKFRRLTMQVLKISFLSAFVLELAATISTAIIAVTLGSRLIMGNIEFYNCLFILLLTPDYFMAIRKFGMKYHVAASAKTAADIITERKNSEVHLEEAKLAVDFTNKKADVVLNDVSYSYKRGEQNALDHVSMHFTPGDVAAVVGKSGSGKSTMAYAVMKLLAPTGGKITINGIDLSQIDSDRLREYISFIPQTPYIFKDTLKNNIIFGKMNATDDEINIAVKAAGLNGLIETLPNGLSEEISDLGSNLSVGEKQRIAVARAFLKNAPLLIVDEAVSAQDKTNEQLLSASFSEFSKDKTVVIIAHRLKTVQSASVIYMLENGRIVEFGKHDDLMKGDGKYKEMICAWEDI